MAQKLYDRSNEKDILYAVQDSLREIGVVPGVGQIVPQHNLQCDFGMDSLDFFDFSFLLGKKLALLPDELNQLDDKFFQRELHTVADVIGAVNTIVQCQKNLCKTTPDNYVASNKPGVVNADYNVFIGTGSFNNVRINPQSIDVQCVNKIIQLMHVTQVPQNFCWKNMEVMANVNCSVGYGVKKPTDGQIFFWVGGRSSNQCGKIISKNNQYNMLWDCVNALQTGKCQDEFMRQTIGAVLFPQFYANNKQK